MQIPLKKRYYNHITWPVSFSCLYLFSFYSCFVYCIVNMKLVLRIVYYSSIISYRMCDWTHCSGVHICMNVQRQGNIRNFRAYKGRCIDLLFENIWILEHLGEWHKITSLVISIEHSLRFQCKHFRSIYFKESINISLTI